MTTQPLWKKLTLVVAWAVGIASGLAFADVVPLPAEIGAIAAPFAFALSVSLTRGRPPFQRAALFTLTVLFSAVYPLGMSTKDAISIARCKSNAVDLNLALWMYSSDHDDRFPAAATWRADIDRMRGIPEDWRCPESSALYSYAMNRAIAGHAHTAIPDPDTLVTVFEHDGKNQNATGAPEDLLKRHHHKGVVGYSQEDTATLLPGPKKLHWKP